MPAIRGSHSSRCLRDRALHWWRSGSVAEDVAAGPPFEVPTEPVFQFGAVERRLLKPLFGIRKRLDFEHHECVARQVCRIQGREIALYLLDAPELKNTIESHRARSR